MKTLYKNTSNKLNDRKESTPQKRRTVLLIFGILIVALSVCILLFVWTNFKDKNIVEKLFGIGFIIYIIPLTYSLYAKRRNNVDELEFLINKNESDKITKIFFETPVTIIIGYLNKCMPTILLALTFLGRQILKNEVSISDISNDESFMDLLIYGMILGWGGFIDFFVAFSQNNFIWYCSTKNIETYIANKEGVVKEQYFNRANIRICVRDKIAEKNKRRS